MKKSKYLSNPLFHFFRTEKKRNRKAVSKTFILLVLLHFFNTIILIIIDACSFSVSFDLPSLSNFLYFLHSVRTFFLSYIFLLFFPFIFHRFFLALFFFLKYFSFGFSNILLVIPPFSHFCWYPIPTLNVSTNSFFC